LIHSIGRETDRDEDAESDASHPGEEEVGSSFVESLASFGSASPPGEGQSGEGDGVDGGAGQALEIDSLVRRSSRDHLLHFRPFHRIRSKLSSGSNEQATLVPMIHPVLSTSCGSEASPPHVPIHGSKPSTTHSSGYRSKGRFKYPPPSSFPDLSPGSIEPSSSSPPSPREQAGGS
jgi:hypothetical protein